MTEADGLYLKHLYSYLPPSHFLSLPCPPLLFSPFTRTHARAHTHTHTHAHTHTLSLSLSLSLSHTHTHTHTHTKPTHRNSANSRKSTGAGRTRKENQHSLPVSVSSDGVERMEGAIKAVGQKPPGCEDQVTDQVMNSTHWLIYRPPDWPTPGLETTSCCPRRKLHSNPRLRGGTVGENEYCISSIISKALLQRM